MKRVALIGHPVGHSVSPAFQNAAFEHTGVAARYEAIDVLGDGLPRLISSLREPEWLGANVTVPHKQAVFRLVDEVDDVAYRVGAVNTVVNRDGRLYATNTDVAGFVRSVEAAGVQLSGANTLVLGAGGSARAVVYGLTSCGARVRIASRRAERTRELASHARTAVPAATIDGIEWRGQDLLAVARECDVIVNCTPMGMLHGPAEHASPLPREAFHAGQWVVDLVYNPPRTPLLTIAAAAGATAIAGLEMLVHQGAGSFEAWTGQPAPIDVMRQAASWALYGATA